MIYESKEDVIQNYINFHHLEIPNYHGDKQGNESHPEHSTDHGRNNALPSRLDVDEENKSLEEHVDSSPTELPTMEIDLSMPIPTSVGDMTPPTSTPESEGNVRKRGVKVLQSTEVMTYSRLSNTRAYTPIYF